MYNHLQLYCCVGQLVVEKDRTQNSGSEHQEELRGLLHQSGNENVSPQPAHLHNLLHNQNQYALNSTLTSMLHDYSSRFPLSKQ